MAAKLEWALRPLTQKQAAGVIGYGYRKFSDILSDLENEGVDTHEPRGVRRVFYPEHIENIRTALKCKVIKRSRVARTGKSGTRGTPIGSQKLVTGQSILLSTGQDFAAVLDYARQK